MTSKKRISLTCQKCGKTFTILPRTDGKPQRTLCFKCLPRKE